MTALDVLRYSPRMCAIIVAPIVLGCVQLSAKETSATTTNQQADEDAIVLSPFVVNADKDVGYTAASSLAGGRTDMALKDISAAVSVMTREFIDDVAATNYQQISEWGVNSQPGTSALANNTLSYTVQIRGPNGSFPSRNYFLWYVNSDSYATERYEYARGPNGVLFGDGNIGGLVTIFTKQPRFDKAAYSVNLRTDTWGGFSERVDINVPASDRMAVRLNLLDVHDQFWRDRSPFRNRGAHLGIAFKLTKKLVFRAEGEVGRGQRAQTLMNYFDGSSYWNGTTINTGAATPITSGTGIGRLSSSDYILYVPSMPQAGVSDWSKQYKTQGTGFAMLPESRSDIVNAPALSSRNYNLQPGNCWQRLDHYNYNFFLERPFGENLFLQLAYSHLSNETTETNTGTSYSNYFIDVNKNLPNGLANPNFLKPYTDGGMDRGLNSNRVDDFRAFLAYKVQNSWAKVSVNAIVGSRMDRFNYLTESVYRTNGTNQNVRATVNQFRLRYYWEDAGKYSNTDEAPVFPGSGYIFGYVPTSIINQRKWIDYSQLATTASFFKGRVTILGGMRRDVFHMTQQTSITNATTGLPAMGATIIPEGSVNPVAVVGAKLRQEFNPISRNAGVVCFPLYWLGFYANYSETFGTPGSGASLLDGSAPGVSRSKGQDYGIKIVFSSKLDMRLNYYKSIQDDMLVGNINTAETDRLWTNIGRSEMAKISWRDTQSLDLNGYEFELTANPTRSLRLTYNIAFPECANVDSYPRFRAYVAKYMPAWQAGASDPNNSQASQIKADINTIKTALDNLVTGATTNNTVKYTSNVYATYSFRKGFLKNYAFGLGANIRGRNKVGYTSASPYEYLYADSYYLLSGHVAYERRFGKVLARFQVNVTNLLNNNDLITTAYSDYRVGGSSANPAVRLPSTFRYLDPRKLTFSTTFSF